MQPDFWHNRWKTDRIGFHQSAFNPYLERFWPALNLAPGTTVLVPLCGKSRDLHWLRAQGHPVLGVELSPVAIAAFFDGHAVVTPLGDHHRLHAGQAHLAGIQIIEGDLFTVPPACFAQVGAFYDRAAIIALPPKLRSRYLDKLATVLPVGAPGIMITIDYPKTEKDGPPFALTNDELVAGLDPYFDRSVLTSSDLTEGNRWNLTRLQELVHAIRRR
jgi:thiopurine S-methyltransferase